MARANTPFSGLTVLDFSRYLPGGYATQVLADLGATVIKVEDTGLGDFMRHDYPTKGGGISYYITALGRNKKSVSLNLKNEEVVDWFKKMAKEADVIVEITIRSTKSTLVLSTAPFLVMVPRILAPRRLSMT